MLIPHRQPNKQAHRQLKIRQAVRVHKEYGLIAHKRLLVLIEITHKTESAL